MLHMRMGYIFMIPRSLHVWIKKSRVLNIQRYDTNSIQELAYTTVFEQGPLCE